MEEFSPNSYEVLPKNTALLISDILSDNEARTPTFGARSPLYIPGENIAVKTGTTNNNKDAWTIGYTPSIVVGVWAGNNDNTPMKKGGAALAGPIWNKFMSEALKNLPSESFETPDLEIDPTKVKPALRGFWQGNENFFIDKVSGKLATENTPRETLEEKVITNVHSILYWVDRNDILGPAPSNPGANPQFDHWEIPLQKWWAQNNGNYKITTWNEKPPTSDDVHTDLSKPTISILEPNDAAIYSPDQRINLKITSSGRFPLQKIDIFINDTYLETREAPFSFSFIPKELENLQSNNELKIIFYDTAYNRNEAAMNFRVEG
ncbi:MAG: penicillin-binding protein, 1A family, nonfunctional [Candidatus Nomurabacteria bacterium GW2011_GWB1_43_7]|uniref:Penicillin-binding protein, 1A family, nonfunctional n=1 Tax=Candidatus Nomurabacteria bacterium GW2011_GWB1_43_7 TaxID=1618747 RepID=A0A0G1HH63_9BACT|nr:MAG: penicillin-binding protein, 1A family, nonfunctional [Candidatus Nomurabacteria bacterium GW2011_GWB1_43_7]